MAIFFERRSLEALEAIYSFNGFESAAKVLGISQSAVSQRFKSLQELCGDLLIIRSQPYELTAQGKKLFNYLQTVKHLEGTLLNDLGLGERRYPLRIGLSRDMLDTWFLNLLHCTKIMSEVNITLTTVDQEETLHLLKRNEVSVALSPFYDSFSKKEPSYVGKMTYVAVATKDFQRRYFPKEMKLEDAILQAPCLVYDKKDNLYYKYLKKHWKINKTPSVVHTVPSVLGFKQLALQGDTLALIPYIDVHQELTSGKLVNLFPLCTWDLSIYMHTCDYLRTSERKIVEKLFQAANKLLNFL